MKIAIREGVRSEVYVDLCMFDFGSYLFGGGPIGVVDKYCDGTRGEFVNLSELKNKYKQHFVFKDEKLSLAEAKELVSLLDKEPISFDNDEMMYKLRNFISRQEYFAANKRDQEKKENQAKEDIESYHNKLKELGTVVVQPGIKHNGQIDYLNVTYHLNGNVIYKWAAGIKIIEMADQLKEVYEGLINESISSL